MGYIVFETIGFSLTNIEWSSSKPRSICIIGVEKEKRSRARILHSLILDVHCIEEPSICVRNPHVIVLDVLLWMNRMEWESLVATHIARPSCYR